MQDVFFQSEIKWWIKKDSQCSLVLAAALAATRAKTNARKHRLVVILVAPAIISTGPLALPPPPPPLHLRHLQQLGGGHLGARQDEGGHRAEAGLKLVRRVLLEATEAAADRTSIRPLLLLLLPPPPSPPPPAITTNLCMPQCEALYCVLEAKGNSAGQQNCDSWKQNCTNTNFSD